MAPNRPDIARLAAKRPIRPDSETEESEYDMEESDYDMEPKGRPPEFCRDNALVTAASNEQQEKSPINGPARPSIARLDLARSLHASLSTSLIGESSPMDDLFLHYGQSHHTFFSPRRPSQAPDSPYSIPHYDRSSDGLSPGAPPPGGSNSKHSLSVGTSLVEVPRITLPPPNGTQIQHVPPHGSGGFKCDHPGCIAAPFQTQYLLK